MTLSPSDNDRRHDSPPLQGRGRGWGLSANTIAELHARAAEMRRNPTEPEKRVWRILSGSQMAGQKFRRQAVLPPYIADFLCPAARLIVEVDGDTHDPVKDGHRDTVLSGRGYRTLRVTNDEVMSNIDGVAWLIATAIGPTTVSAARPLPNPSPEGEGLMMIDAPERDFADMEWTTNAQD
jgi:very-short-patch-repair endonuclease